MANSAEDGIRHQWGVDVKAVLIAGIVAAIAFLAIELALMPIMGFDVSRPLRTMAAILVGSRVLAPAVAFTVGILVAALLVHVALSLFYTFLLGLFIRGHSMEFSVVVGVIFGFALYVMNFHVFSSIYPWVAEARSWVTVLAHLVFGAVAAGVYIRAELPVGEEDQLERRAA